MKHAISKHKYDFIAVVALIAIATGVSAYILENQRMRFPIVESAPFRLKAAFSTGQAVTPGQGQTVRISGVRIGDISKVGLEDGRAIITMDIDPKYEGIVRENWQALLRPKTGLKDMFIELFPGEGEAPAAKENYVLPIGNTLPDVNPDEFLASLDRDTRDYLKLLLQGASKGLEGRAGDLRMVLKRFEPTYRDIARVSSAVATRREELRRLVRSLNLLNTELGRSDDDLSELVLASSQVFRAFASEQDNVAATVRELPGALRQTTDTLRRVESMAKVLRPAADEIRPAIRALERSNDATVPFAREAAPLLEEEIRPFVRAARPVVRQLRPAAHDLAEADPDLTRTIKVLNTLFDYLAYNKNGKEGPEVAGRDEGYLFYLAWLAHQSIQIFSGQDAHGVYRPLVPGGTCNILQNTAQTVPGYEFLGGLTGVLNDPAICGADLPGPTKKKGGRR